MNYLLKRVTMACLVLVLFLSVPITIFAYGIEQEHNNYLLKEFDHILNQEFLTNDLTAEHVKILELYNDYSNHYINIDERSREIITRASIQASLTRMDAISSFIPMSNHALERVNERDFTSDIVASLMHEGTRYLDSRGSQILHDDETRTALILGTDGIPVVTAIDNVNLQQKINGPQQWVLNGW